MVLRNYANVSIPQALTSGVSDSSVTIPVATTAGWPAAPFLLCFERGTANAEVALCSAKTANSFTVSRGFDGTTAVAHDVGTIVEHCSAEIDFREANDHVNSPHLDPTIINAAGDLIVGTADNAVDNLPVGATLDHALLADPSQVMKMRWADIGLGAWTSWTPTWGAAGVAPSIGNGTIIGRYKKIGKTLDFYMSLLFGSSTYKGVGLWYFGLPPGCSAYTSGIIAQFALAYVNKLDVAVAATSLFNTTVFYILTQDNSPAIISNQFVDGTIPSNWVNGDVLRVWGRIEIV